MHLTGITQYTGVEIKGCRDGTMPKNSVGMGLCMMIVLPTIIP